MDDKSKSAAAAGGASLKNDGDVNIVEGPLLVTVADSRREIESELSISRSSFLIFEIAASFAARLLPP